MSGAAIAAPTTQLVSRPNSTGAKPTAPITLGKPFYACNYMKAVFESSSSCADETFMYLPIIIALS